MSTQHYFRSGPALLLGKDRVGVAAARVLRVRPSEHAELCTAKSSLNTSCSRICAVVKSPRSLIKVLGHLVLSPASMGWLSGRFSSGVSYGVVRLPGRGTLTTAVPVPQLASACRGDLVLPGKGYFNLRWREKGMTSSGHAI